MDFSRRGGLFSIKPKSRFLQARLERKGKVLEREGDSGQGDDGGGEGERKGVNDDAICGKVQGFSRYPSVRFSWLVGGRERELLEGTTRAARLDRMLPILYASGGFLGDIPGEGPKYTLGSTDDTAPSGIRESCLPSWYLGVCLLDPDQHQGRCCLAWYGLNVSTRMMIAAWLCPDKHQTVPYQRNHDPSLVFQLGLLHEIEPFRPTPEWLWKGSRSIVRRPS